MKKSIGLSIAFTMLLASSFSGCSSQPEPEIKTANGQVCVSSSIKVAELVDKASKAFHRNYKFDGGRCNNITIQIEDGNHCFNSLSEIDYFIQNNTKYLLEVNTKKDNGLPVYGLTVKQAIDYFNSKGSPKKIIFIDDDLRLKDNLKLTIKTMADLKKYVAKTTPFYFAKLHNDKKTVVYTLRYKRVNKRLGDSSAIVMNLKEARRLTKEIETMNPQDRVTIIRKINTVIKGVENYEK